MKSKNQIQAIFSLLIGIMFIVLSCSKEPIIAPKEVDETECHVKQMSSSNSEQYKAMPQTAAEMAKHFISSMDKTLANAQVKEILPLTDQKGEVCMYAINFIPRGNVIISADIRNVEPIFSFSTTGHFSKSTDDEPDALTCMINEAIFINKVLEEEYTNPKVKTLLGRDKDMLRANPWFAYELTKYDPPEAVYEDPCRGKPAQKILPDTILYEVGPLIQTRWKQREPYNCYIKGKAVAGCVTVAIAQIMRFHKHPNRFNWDIMPDTCKNSCDNMTEGEQEVAKLMADIYYKGVIAISNSAGTFILPEFAVKAFKKYGYNKQISLGRGLDLPSFYNEIVKNRRPVFMCGLPPKGTNPKKGKGIFWKGDVFNGHAFVLDGYRSIISGRYIDCEGKVRKNPSSGFLHINFGWGGSRDQWVRIIRDYNNGKYSYRFGEFEGGDDVNYFDTQRYITNIYPQ